MQVKPFPGRGPGDLSASKKSYLITAEMKDTPLPYLTVQVTIGVSGDFTYLEADGTPVTIPQSVIDVQPVQDIECAQINSTGTTADDIFVKC